MRVPVAVPFETTIHLSLPFYIRLISKSLLMVETRQRRDLSLLDLDLPAESYLAFGNKVYSSAIHTYACKNDVIYHNDEVQIVEFCWQLHSARTIVDASIELMRAERFSND